ncbi:purine-cytosine permease family protein [Leeia oryzae]|uniref:purine-cytosine permease family protein n=1 Tax=Leeia oryzae TaxID=356662 RepID=UPI00037F5BE1|nr:cytosine permease [Leeia oryzae]
MAQHNTEATAQKRGGIETRSIDYVPENERHGKVSHQGPFWFLGNFQFFTIAIGFIGPSMGLSLGYTALAGALGILFGTLFMAFHASQGAELGLPQMVQSRAQFGYRGVVLVLIGTLFTFVGFNVVDTVLVASGLHGIFGWNETSITLVIAIISTLLAIYGHDWLHRIFQLCFVISLPLYIILTLAIFMGGAGGKAPAVALGFNLVAFAAQFAASASYNITYAPYVSDYSRYLPRHTKPSSIITAVFFGASSSAIWLIALGAWLATHLGASDGLVALHDSGNAVMHGFGSAVALTSVAALVATMGLNAYSGMLTVVTAIDALRKVTLGKGIRIVTIVLLAIIWVGISLSISGDAIGILFAVLTVMLYLLVPWTAVNLVDYFFVRRGKYAITHFFTPNGIYGAWGAKGITAYLIGFVVTIPFFVLPGVYTGPAAAALGGVDLAWLVGLIVSSLTYFALSRSIDLDAEIPVIEQSEKDLKKLQQVDHTSEESAVPAGASL